MSSMSQIFTGGAYKTRSLIGSAQTQENWIVEQIPQQQDEPIQFIHYPRPGLTLQGFGPNSTFGWRCLYTASNGDLWGVNGNQVFWIEATGIVNLVGTLTPLTLDDMAQRSTPVSMADNGSILLIVDGSSTGWYANVITHNGLTAFDANSSPPPDSAPGATMSGWPGGTRAEYSDTFFIVNQPGTFEFSTSDSEAVTWDPLNFASKVAKPDPLAACVVIQRTLWLIGTQSIEIWINSGGQGVAAVSNNTFPYSALPTAQFDIGCAAPYSIARGTAEVFWLAKNEWGQGLVMRGAGQNIQEVSTYYIAYEISTYDVISDAIGMIFQQAGHTFYMLTFPTQDVTWVYDLSNGLWQKYTWTDSNGIQHRHRANCISAAYGQVWVGDWANSNLYAMDQTNHTDNGQMILCKLAGQHLLDVQGNARIRYLSLIARLQVGSPQGSNNTTAFLNTSFTAPDGTLLENYSSPNDIGATFTKDSGNSCVILDDTVNSIMDGASLYTISGTSTSPDYNLNFKISPTSYETVQPSGSTIYLIGRANSSHDGYQMAVSSDGSQYQISLNVMATDTTQTLPLGTLLSGNYAATLTMQGQAISVSIQRSQDGNWLDPGGTWTGSLQVAISINDATYAEPGINLWGGNWTT